MFGQLCTAAFLYACFAFVWVAVLVQPGNIFSWLPPLFKKFPEWFRHVAFNCEKCLAGQLSFWIPLFLGYKSYDLFSHIYVVFLAIMFAAFIGRIYDKLY